MSISTYPFSGPSVVDGSITVDLLLQEPTRITKYVADLAAKQLFAASIFTAGNASGGAIIFDQLTKNDVYSEGTAKVSAGGEFPNVSSDKGEPLVAKVEKTGGKFKVTDEARKRNDQALIQRESRKLANTIVRDIDTTALAALNAGVAALGSDALTVQSGGWVLAGKTTNANKTAAASARADILRAKAAGAKTELGYNYNLLIMHPDDDLALQIALESDANVQAFYAANGLTPIVSAQATAGTPKLVAGGTVGTMGIEDPLSSEVFDDRKIQSTWYQSWMTAAFGVTDPYAIIDITNVAAAS